MLLVVRYGPDTLIAAVCAVQLGGAGLLTAGRLLELLLVLLLLVLELLLASMLKFPPLTSLLFDTALEEGGGCTAVAGAAVAPFELLTALSASGTAPAALKFLCTARLPPLRPLHAQAKRGQRFVRCCKQ